MRFCPIGRKRRIVHKSVKTTNVELTSFDQAQKEGRMEVSYRLGNAGGGLCGFDQS